MSTARCPPTSCDGLSTSSPHASRRARLTAISAAKRAVDVALDEQTDLTTGLRVEDQLMREALAQPVARERLQAILDAGAQTREFELGEIRP